MNAKCKDNSRVECPKCGHENVWRNGISRAGKQQYRCKICGRVFILEPYIPNSIKKIADRMLEHEIEVPTAARILEGFVSRRWLYLRRETLNARD